jgi:hypothetical protein
MTKQMILQGGPLDGEKQVTLDLNTNPGYNMQFSLSNFQNFHPDGVTVASQGLTAVYTFLGPGPAPNPGSPDFDTWDSSWIYQFTGTMTIPPPGPITPPTIPPQPTPAMFMNVNSGLTVDVSSYDPTSPGVQMVDWSHLHVEGTWTSFDYATVAMSGETVFQVAAMQWDVWPAMAATASMTVISS